MSRYRNEDLPLKIRSSIVAFGQFKERHGSATENLHVYQSRAFPGFAAIAVDLDSPGSMILYSPYLMSAMELHVEHGDSPHYLATSSSGSLLRDLTTLIGATIDNGALERVL